MPFGFKNVTVTFTRMMRKLLQPLGRKDIHNFVMDVLVVTVSFDQHLEAIDLVLTVLGNEALMAEPSKCFFGFDSLIFLGHQWSAGKLMPDDEMINKLKQAPRLRTKKEVKSFQELAGYNHCFIPSFAEIHVAVPLTDATKKGMPEQINWDTECEKAFSQLKEKLCSKPVLIMPDPDKTLILRTDASNLGMGAVLMQEVDGTPHPVSFACKNFNIAQRNYAVIKKEGLAVIWTWKYYHQHLYGHHFVLESDHRPLQILRVSRCAYGRIT